MTIITASYLITVSIVLFVLMGIDKKNAKRKQWRVAESTLFLMAIIGGAVGGVFGMYVFKHKTRKNKFAFGFPLLAAVQIFLMVRIVEMSIL